MLKNISFLVILCCLVTFAYAQEEITITTYYPSPFGSYRELETETLFFRETTNGLISFHYPDTTYDRRLRITAGLSDTGHNDQGASIDLHGNAAGGRLDLVAGRGGYTSFWTSPAGTAEAERMRITSGGNVGIGTTGPNAKLQVNGTINALSLGSTPLSTSGNLQVTGTGPHYVSQGNVGIGTTSPAEKLEVAGNIKLTGNIVKTGTVANVAMVQTRTQATYSAPISGYGTVITPLTLVITPKKAGNRIILEWIVNGEMYQDTVYIVTRNGVLLADTTNAANNRWAGITAQPYDGNTNSTPDNAVVKIIDMDSLDVTTTYELWVRSSYGGAQTLYLNRTALSAGQDNYEACLSVGIATEIWW